MVAANQSYFVKKFSILKKEHLEKTPLFWLQAYCLGCKLDFFVNEKCCLNLFWQLLYFAEPSSKKDQRLPTEQISEVATSHESKTWKK